jgi:RHS repeat-associated protein
MTSDNNKAISSIVYNYLNLPQTITVTGKGSIAYTYDAAGNKLKKVTTDNTVTPAKVTTTDYMAGFVYENDVLQFTGHEEGRIRYVQQFYPDGTNAWTWQYDYFLKDHLGNVRTVLTEQQDVAKYMATFETAERAKETALFSNIAETAIAITGITGYPADGTTTPNDYTSYMNGHSRRLGASVTLKVMAGDKVDIGVKYFYTAYAGGGQGPAGGAQSLLNALLATLSSKVSGLSGDKATPADLSNTSGTVYSGLNSFLTQHTDDPNENGRPKAYLNWFLLDEQFNYVPASSGFIRVDGYDAAIRTLATSGLPITKSGYLFVYLSNETSRRWVTFDNLVVQHYTGPLTEETQYYPFGLTMSGISSKAAGKVENKKKFNSYEYNNDFDINLYESFYRSNDPQLGRFWQLDPKPDERVSLYAAMGNNPISLNDLLGDTSIYYNSNGEQIGFINKGKGITAVEVAANWTYFVTVLTAGINARSDLSDKDVAAFSALLQATGTAYDVSSFSKFFDENAKSTPAISVAGESIKGWSDIKLNGKKSKLYAEVEGNIVMKNGKLTVGSGKHSIGDMTYDFPSNLPNEPGKKSHIHLHPIAEDSKLTYSFPDAMGRGRSQGTGYLKAGPSGAKGDQDQARINMQNNGARTVVVDAKYVYLINGTSNQTIKIPR